MGATGAAFGFSIIVRPSNVLVRFQLTVEPIPNRCQTRAYPELALPVLGLDAAFSSFINYLHSGAVAGNAFLTEYPDVFAGLFFLVVGILVIALLIAAAVVLLPAILIAAFVWFLTGSFLFAGISFLVVAVLWLAVIAED